MFRLIRCVRCKNFKKEFEAEKLTVLVQERSVLFDTGNINYKNIILKA